MVCGSEYDIFVCCQLCAPCTGEKCCCVVIMSAALFESVTPWTTCDAGENPLRSSMDSNVSLIAGVKMLRPNDSALPNTPRIEDDPPLPYMYMYPYMFFRSDKRVVIADAVVIHARKHNKKPCHSCTDEHKVRIHLMKPLPSRSTT